MNGFTTVNLIAASSVALVDLKTGYGNDRGNVSAELRMLWKRVDAQAASRVTSLTITA
ncbi:hypothetical protein [uncultured Nostoc sp.]|uniref:hypothetical protein n=1 Tax=uncultured Nostoc sp. TaxID=340711 RepID=UPI0035C9D272